MSDEIPAVYDLHKHPSYEPYALSLGRLVNSWNLMQEALGSLFWAVIGTSDGAIPLAIWHSVPSDHSQREMLRAAITAATGQERINRFPMASKDILWLLKEAGSVRNGRNDAVHAPLGVRREEHGFRIVPWSMFGNPRAKSLEGKDILSEIAWYQAKADVLGNFALQLTAPLWFPESHKWPDRPELPTLGRSKGRKK